MAADSSFIRKRFLWFVVGVGVGVVISALVIFLPRNRSDRKALGESENLQVAPVTGANQHPDHSSMQSRMLGGIRVRNRIPDLVPGVSLAENLKIAEGIEDLDDRARFSGKIIVEWVKTDPEACFLWAQNIVDMNLRSSALVDITQALLRSGRTEEALKYIDRVSKGELKDDMIVNAQWDLLRSDFSKALQLSEQLSNGGAIDAVVRRMSEYLISSDQLKEAGNVLNSMPEGQFREALYREMISKMAENDPEKAFTWFSENSSFSNREALSSIATAFANKDPLRGIELGDTLSNDKDKAQYMAKLGSKWGRNSPQDSFQWMMDQMKGGKFSQYGGLIDGIIRESIQWDHNQAIANIRKISNEEDRAKATLIATKALAKFDPQSSAALIEQIPAKNESDRISATMTITASWMDRDPMAASQWVSSLASGPQKDSAIGQVIVNLINVGQDTAMARKWASEILSPEQRNLAISRIEEFEMKNR